MSSAATLHDDGCGKPWGLCDCEPRPAGKQAWIDKHMARAHELAVNAATRCGYVTAAGIRCRRDDGHAGAHDTLYIFDALPERPEPVDDPLPEDLERLLRDPRIVIDRDGDVAALFAGYLIRHPEVETVTRGAYLMLWALYRKEHS